MNKFLVNQLSFNSLSAIIDYYVLSIEISKTGSDTSDRKFDLSCPVENTTHLYVSSGIPGRPVTSCSSFCAALVAVRLSNIVIMISACRLSIKSISRLKFEKMIKQSSASSFNSSPRQLDSWVRIWEHSSKVYEPKNLKQNHYLQKSHVMEFFLITQNDEKSLKTWKSFIFQDSMQKKTKIMHQWRYFWLRNRVETAF